MNTTEMHLISNSMLDTYTGIGICKKYALMPCFIDSGRKNTALPATLQTCRYVARERVLILPPSRLSNGALYSLTE